LAQWAMAQLVRVGAAEVQGTLLINQG
jgi:hypothetical protein